MTELDMVGSYMQGQGQIDQDRTNALNARAAGYSQEAQYRNDATRKIADQVAALSNRGESLSSGTPLSLVADSARNAELDALSIRAKANNQGAMYDYKASQEQQALPFTMGAKFLSDTSKIATLGGL